MYLGQIVSYNHTNLPLLGMEINVNRLSTRVFLFSILVTFFGVYSFYTSLLVSFTTVSKSESPFKTLNQLLIASNPYEVGYVKGGAMDDAINVRFI